MTKSAALEPITNPASREKIAYDAIKGAILSFQIQPGEALIEGTLAKQLGISKTPVRESLSRLEKEGFIVKTPYKGYTAADISTTEVIEIFQTRAVLEGLAARLSAERMSPEDLHRIANVLAAHELAISANRFEQAATLNRQFHQLIILKAANQRLMQILANLDDHLVRYRLLATFQPGRQEKSIHEHRKCLEALRQGNPDSAETTMRGHLLSVLEDLATMDFQTAVSRVRAGEGFPGRLTEALT